MTDIFDKDDLDWSEWIGTVAKPEPDMEIAKAFWNEVAPGEPIRLRFLNKKATMGPSSIEREYASVEEAWPEVEGNQKAGYDVYYFPNTPSLGWRGGKFAGDLHVNRVRALFVDLDKGLPEQFHCKPNLIVYTSVTADGTQKAQALWLVNYPTRTGQASFDSGYARGFKEAERDLLMGYPTADPAAVNISRVLRLPGSLHMKNPDKPQLVTFDVVHSDGPPRPAMAPTAHRRLHDDILAGLPEREHRAAPKGEKQDHPVGVDHLRHLLGFVTPDCGYEEWRNILYAIRSTRLLSAVPEDYPGRPNDYETLLTVALEWSRGEFDHAARYADGPPNAYYGHDGSGGDDQIVSLFEGADPDGEITFGSIVHYAKTGGWQPSGSKTEPGPTKDDDLPSWVPRDVLRSGRHYAMRPSDYKNAPAFKFFDDDNTLPDNPDGAVGMLYANYSSHKTNWAVSKSISLIIKSELLIVYAAGEGDIDVGKLRVSAHSKAYGKTVADFDRNFVIVPSVPTLASDPPYGNQPRAKDRAEFIKLLHEIERERGQKINIIWIDTLAIATLGMEENSSEFGGLLTKAGPIGLLAKEFKALVIVIHHTGKNEERGARGSNSLNCNIDCIFECKYDEEHELLRVYNEKNKTGAPRTSTFYRISTDGWTMPVPIQIDLEEFEQRGGVIEKKKKKRGQEADSNARALRDWLRTQVEKWPTWEEGLIDSEVAKLYLETHGDPEPPSGKIKDHTDWASRRKKLTQAFTNCHHKSGVEPGVAKHLGDWKVEGKNEAWRWRWFNNGLVEEVSF